jgi:CDP-glucose 4,6-dehydratase
VVHWPRTLEGVVIRASSFWEGRRVLITGHTGFKGSWMWQWLTLLGADVYGLALPPSTKPNLFHLAELQDQARSRFGDVRHSQKVRAFLREVKPEIVFHMAGQSLVRNSYRDPLKTLETNLLGTAYVLNAIRLVHNVRCAIIVTSDKCYRPGSSRTIHREEDPLGGEDPYSASKACAEIVVESWRRAFFMDSSSPGIASVRAGNVIGGGDWSAHRLIPDCVRAFQSGRPVAIRNANAIRPWQYVLDALGGYFALAERLYYDPLRFAQAWNFGPGAHQSTSVLSVVQQFGKHWQGSRWILTDHPNIREQPRLAIDSGKAREQLSWQPKLSLEESLAWTAEWYRRQAAGESASKLCAEQLGRFQQTHMRSVPA